MMEAYTTQRDSLIQMFLDGTEGETYYNGRLQTRRSGENTIELIAYTWNKIAEYDESTDTVTIFAGHKHNISPTVTRYINLVHEMASTRQSRTIELLGDSAPNVARPPADSVQFIKNYRSFSGSSSSVEEWATEKVNNALLSRL